MAQTILLIDDEVRLRDMLRVYLEQEGYRVVEAEDGRKGLFVARYEKPDLIILDIMMPELGGYEFMRSFSKESDVPVIMLTAKIEENDKVVGLELGADDYVTKPFGVSELLARIRAVLRRSQRQNVKPDILRAEDVMLDRSGHVVKVGEQYVDLTPSEFQILATLMGTPGRAFSRLDLLERTSGDAFEGYERTIDVHVRNLRAKIELDPGNPRYIETVYGMGYRFTVEHK